MAVQDPFYIGGTTDGFVGENAIGVAPPAVTDVFHVGLSRIQLGEVANTAAGMDGVLQT